MFLLKREEAEEHSEGFSTRYDNKFIDSLEIGDKIDTGEYVKKSTNFDKSLIDTMCPSWLASMIMRELLMWLAWVIRPVGPNRSEHMNYRYGKNINVVYLVAPFVYEDGILAMNGVEDMFNTFRSHTKRIKLADNEVLVNLYGDSDLLLLLQVELLDHPISPGIRHLPGVLIGQDLNVDHTTRTITDPQGRYC